MPKTNKNFLITSPANIQYLSNFTGSSGFMLITNNKKYLFTDSRYIQRAQNSVYQEIEIIDTTKMWKNKEELEKNWQKILKKHQIQELGIEESHLTLARFKNFKNISKIDGKQIKFSNISGIIEKDREIKNENELKLIIKSQQINEKVFKEAQATILNSKNTSEISIAWKIRELGYQYGAEDVSFDPIVAFGKNSSSPHHNPGKTKLKENDTVLIDMGMKYQGYCSDMTRTFFVGKTSPKQFEIYEIVLKAQLEGIKIIKDNISGADIDQKIRSIIETAGYGDYYGHASGHGIGLDIHESPSLSQGYQEKISANTVVTVEPGIYLPGKFGVRIEDMVLVTKNGNKNLTKITKAPTI